MCSTGYQFNTCWTVFQLCVQVDKWEVTGLNLARPSGTWYVVPLLCVHSLFSSTNRKSICIIFHYIIINFLKFHMVLFSH